MDTVLGLSVTPTTFGWVLAEGHDADGAILGHRELQVQDGRHEGHGVRAISTAEQVAAEVLRARDIATASDHRLHVVGVTWTDEAAAQAALLQEALADAGFDNVVPVRLLDAVETLAKAIAPVIGYQQTAVCILEHEWATVVMVDTHDGETQTAVKHVRGGFDGLSSWLSGMFDRNTWRPAGVVVVGAEEDVSDFSWQLEKVLPVPVFAQTMAQVTVARGAALTAAQSTEFTDAELVALVDGDEEPVAAAPARSRRQYAGAATTLTAAAVAFVASVSAAVGLALSPGNGSGAGQHVGHEPKPPVAEAVASPAAPTSRPPAPVHLTGGAQVDESVPGGQPNRAAPVPEPAAGPYQLSGAIEQLPDAIAEPSRPPE
ncbi:DUF7159 family protein [Mycobacterium vicinigordonae]|uniref:DUF7159 family protein n=1 Tax=Mycobacterium vicinigordonae TaxID=1719132 RepID=UPI001FE6EA54|nr:hypothetical protein [Mycobacterium vicinigordonae]